MLALRLATRARPSPGLAYLRSGNVEYSRRVFLHSRRPILCAAELIEGAESDTLLPHHYPENIKIGVPAEIYPNERRVALTPTSVKQLTDKGYKGMLTVVWIGNRSGCLSFNRYWNPIVAVLVEEGAGLGSKVLLWTYLPCALVA